jgi:F-type H+-transporting ATPase subunit gamma
MSKDLSALSFNKFRTSAKEKYNWKTMSKLVQMRSRIETIETIKKVTDAMRVISMSAHSRLKVQQEPLKLYLDELSLFLAKVQQATPSWSNERIMPTKEDDHSPLIILIGSQKGLCGGFNTQLSKFLSEFLSNYVEQKRSINYQFCAIGKKAVDYLSVNYPDKLVSAFPVLSARNFSTIAEHITQHIMTATPAYTSVTVISNLFKSFFIQKPTISSLIPFNPTTITTTVQPPAEGYLWDAQPHIILDELAVRYIEAQLQQLIFQSLFAEHAARFISMDNSTRNAMNLLETTKLEYNKLRQSKITTEITELTGSF